MGQHVYDWNGSTPCLLCTVYKGKHFFYHNATKINGRGIFSPKILQICIILKKSLHVDMQPTRKNVRMTCQRSLTSEMGEGGRNCEKSVGWCYKNKNTFCLIKRRHVIQFCCNSTFFTHNIIICHRF